MSVPTRARDSEVPVWARAADIVVVLLMIAAAAVALTGGLQRTTVFGYRFSMTSAVRLVVWAAVLAAIRHWFARRHPLLRRLCSTTEDDPRVAEARQYPAWHVAAVAAAAIVLTIAMTWPQAARMDSVPDIGDPLLSTWRAAWVAHQLPRDPLHLFDANIFHPERRTLAFSDSMLLPAAMSAPLLWAGVHQIVAYNLLFLSSFVLATVCMFLFVRRLAGHTGAAVVAAVIFGFYPYRFEHYSHLELQMSFWMPLALWAFHRTLERGALRDGLLTGLAIAGQTLSSIYYGLFLVTCLLPLGFVLWRTRGVPASARRALAAGALVLAVVVAPVAVPYIQTRKLVGERSGAEVHFYSAVPEDYVSAHPRSRTWGWLKGTAIPERQLFPGAIVIALAIVGLWPPLTAVRRAYALTLALAFDLSFGLNGLIYPALYAYVFPYRGLRVPARISIVVGFLLAVFAAWGVRRIMTRLPPRLSATVVPVAISAGVLLECRPSLTLEPIWKTPPPAYARVDPSAVIAEFPMPAEETQAWFDTKYMYFSTFHWRRMVNGSSGFDPPSHVRFLERMTAFPSAESLAYLKELGVGYVIVHGAFMEPAEYSKVRAALDTSAALSVVERFEFEGREGTTYRVN